MNNHEDKLLEIKYLMKIEKLLPKQIESDLIKNGMDENLARELILKVIEEYKKELLEEKNKNETQIIKEYFSYLVIGGIGAINMISDINSIIWKIVLIIIIGIAGYYSLPKKPIAGILRAIIFIILFPIAINYYFSDRTTFVKIEMAIPIIIAAIPAFLVQLFISSIFYKNVKD